MIILASSSPRRTELLTAAGIKHRVLTENTSEIKDGAPAEVVMENARLKAEAVAAAISDGKYQEESESLKALPVLVSLVLWKEPVLSWLKCRRW